jgi:hypothetical protein
VNSRARIGTLDGLSTDHEVKGVWFVTARQEVEATFGPEALEVLVASVPSRHRPAVAEPLASAWYPEEALQACLRSLRLDLVSDHSVRFAELLERCTERGMGTFFSALVRVCTPRFILGQVPTMWRQIRRGPGFVEVEHGDGESALRYRSFPYFDDPVYEELTVCSVRAVVRCCTRVEPELTVERVTGDALDLRLRYG